MSNHTPEQSIVIHGSFQVIATENGPVYACPDCQHRFPDANPYAHITAMERAAPDMYEALKDARDAINTLPQEALGTAYAVIGGEQMPFPIRDQLIDKITKALAKAEAQ